MDQNKDNQPLMVSIRCIAYNQERYISQQATKEKLRIKS